MAIEKLFHSENFEEDSSFMQILSAFLNHHILSNYEANRVQQTKIDLPYIFKHRLKRPSL